MIGLLTLWVPSDQISDEENIVWFDFVLPVTLTTKDCFSCKDLNERSFGTTSILIFGIGMIVAV
jgi:hypothetical protein